MTTLRNHRISLSLILLLTICAVSIAADDPRPVVDDSHAATQQAARPDLPTLFVVGDSNRPQQRAAARVGFRDRRVF